jgi:hypothetical protein
MRENKSVGHVTQERSICQIGYYLGGSPSSCAQPAKVNVDGLVFCDKHALEAKLEGQIACWDGILAHVELWSREASRRDRPDIVGLLEIQRAEATSAIARAYEDLDLARSETSGGETPLGYEVFLKRGSLPLPPRGARPLSRGHRRLRRR